MKTHMPGPPARALATIAPLLLTLAMTTGCGLTKHYAAGRVYWIHEPVAFNPMTPSPVVLILHGWGDSGPAAAEMTGFNDVADAHGFVAVYPQGRTSLFMPRSWNAQLCCNSAVSLGTDDVAYLRAVLDDLRDDQGYTIDPDRVYVAGFSNGAMMALSFAARESTRIAAVAAVAGAIAATAPAVPSVPVSLVTYHGTADQAVRFTGGTALIAGAPAYASADELIAQWRSWTGCDSGPVPGGAGNVNEQTWTGPGTLAVRQGVIAGGNHGWPGGKAVSLAGEHPTSDYPASQEIWEFFAQHPKH